MAVFLSSFGGAGAQFFDNNGVPLAGGLIYTYAAGTTTPQATYTSNSGSIAQANPIVLDASGRVPSGEIWLTQLLTYKFVLQTSGGTTIGTYDNISSIAGSIPTIACIDVGLMLPPMLPPVVAALPDITHSAPENPAIRLF